jgi:5-phospho-D-xylono-1,4-lactonase
LASLPGIATANGLNVVAATGRHRAVHHELSAAATRPDDLAMSFIRDITSPAHPCGPIKIGTGYHHLDRFERTSLEAAAQAHARTGVPIAIHLELGTAGDLVLNELDSYRVPLTSIAAMRDEERW